jgi:alpha-N-arabinofuranosidase
MDKKGFLTIYLEPATCSKKVNPAFVAHRQQNLKSTATTSLQFSTNSENEKAGLTIFQNETHFYYLCVSVNEKKPVVQLYQSTKDSSMQLITSVPISLNKKGIQLKIEANRDVYNFYYSINNKWELLKDNVDGKFLSTKTAGGFVGSMFALYATSLGKETDNEAYFDWFEYKGNDEIPK